MLVREPDEEEENDVARGGTIRTRPDARSSVNNTIGSLREEDEDFVMASVEGESPAYHRDALPGGIDALENESNDGLLSQLDFEAYKHTIVRTLQHCLGGGFFAFGMYVFSPTFLRQLWTAPVLNLENSSVTTLINSLLLLPLSQRAIHKVRKQKWTI